MSAELLKASFTEIVATVCFQVGFEKASFEAIDILTDVLHKYLSNLSGFIAALGGKHFTMTHVFLPEDSYFGILDGVITLEVLDQPLESLLTFADEVAAYMPRPVPTKCLPLYGPDRLHLPPKEQYALTALQLSHLPSGPVAGPCQQNLPPWAARVSYRLTRVTYDPVTKRLSEHEPPTPIAVDTSSLAHRRSKRPSTSAFRRSSAATATQLSSPMPLLGAPSPRRAYNSKDAWAAALQLLNMGFEKSGYAVCLILVFMESSGLCTCLFLELTESYLCLCLFLLCCPLNVDNALSRCANRTPSISTGISATNCREVFTPIGFTTVNAKIIPADIGNKTRLCSVRGLLFIHFSSRLWIPATKRTFRSRKRRPSFGRRRPPASKRFALSSVWKSGPSSVPSVPEADEKEEKESVAVKEDESDGAGGLKLDARTPAASCHSSSTDIYHQTFGFSPDSSPSDLNYDEEIFHRKEGDTSLPAETTLTPKLPSPALPTPPTGVHLLPHTLPLLLLVISPVRSVSPGLCATDRTPAAPRSPDSTKDRLKLSPRASSPPRLERSETIATPAAESKPRSTRATESLTAAVSDQTKIAGGQRPLPSKSSKKKAKKTPFSFPPRGVATPKRRLPDSKASTVASKKPSSPGNDLPSIPSPSAYSDSNTEPMTDRERSTDFEMPLQQREPPPCSPKRREPSTLLKTDSTSASFQSSLPPAPSQAAFLSGSGTTQPTVLHFPPTKRPRSRTSSSLSSLSSHSSSSSSSSSSPSSGSFSILCPLPPSPGRGVSTQQAPPLPAGPPPFSSLTCLSQAPATVCRGPIPGPPPPCSLSPITNPRALESSAPSLAESDDGAKTPQAKQTSSPSSPATRTLSSISQRGAPATVRTCQLSDAGVGAAADDLVYTTTEFLHDVPQSVVIHRVKVFRQIHGGSVEVVSHLLALLLQLASGENHVGCSAVSSDATPGTVPALGGGL
ncbi:unnamed protein product [Schistocephalus solidus]|uniref:BTP domain-containing protein n=1 Tax=Schistocephalus solidus TaxID=70667 RepID=A0A183TA73_SCHSO|nr:unnamed protein product [Schistocephalus solidus]